MKYPSVYLDGEGAGSGTMLSIAFANAGQHQDTGAKMIHNAPHTQPRLSYPNPSRRVAER